MTPAMRTTHAAARTRAVAGLTDVNTFVGGYAFRHVPHPDAATLVRVLEREAVAAAWVGHLPSVFHRDPTPGNDELLAWTEPHAGVLFPIPVVRPDWPLWQRTLTRARELGAPAVRAYPPQWGMAPGDRAMRALAGACGEAGVVLLLTTRLEDGRQRHWLDSAGDLTAAAVRDIVRAHARVQVLVTAAGRAMIEEVHWGLTAQERARLWWDISWIWGPPEDDLAHLLRTLGADRFVYGSGWPLRLAQTPRANLDLLPDALRKDALATARAVVAAARGAE
ncbi:MAG TPA: amidohydrolase family protein [Gemmatimonadaceae bacterium]|nr:amidohydrolase family protein [Gemmatimonadaceae bacterium]